MANKEATITRDAFGTIVPKHCFDAVDCSNKFTDEWTLKLNEDGSTTPIKSGKRDLDAEIQSFKDQAGMEGMLNMIRIGRALPVDYVDDGDHNFDGVGLNTELAAAAEAAPHTPIDALQAQLDAIQAQINAAQNTATETKVESPKEEK